MQPPSERPTHSPTNPKKPNMQKRFKKDLVWWRSSVKLSFPYWTLFFITHDAPFLVHLSATLVTTNRLARTTSGSTSTWTGGHPVWEELKGSGNQSRTDWCTATSCIEYDVYVLFSSPLVYVASNVVDPYSCWLTGWVMSVCKRSLL